MRRTQILYLLILSLALQPTLPAFALRPTQLEKKQQRAGLEGALAGLEENAGKKALRESLNALPPESVLVTIRAFEEEGMRIAALTGGQGFVPWRLVLDGSGKVMERQAAHELAFHHKRNDLRLRALLMEVPHQGDPVFALVAADRRWIEGVRTAQDLLAPGKTALFRLLVSRRKAPGETMEFLSRLERQGAHPGALLEAWQADSASWEALLLPKQREEIVSWMEDYGHPDQTGFFERIVRQDSAAPSARRPATGAIALRALNEKLDLIRNEIAQKVTERFVGQPLLVSLPNRVGDVTLRLGRKGKEGRGPDQLILRLRIDAASGRLTASIDRRFDKRTTTTHYVGYEKQINAILSEAPGTWEPEIGGPHPYPKRYTFHPSPAETSAEAGTPHVRPAPASPAPTPAAGLEEVPVVLRANGKPLRLVDPKTKEEVASLRFRGLDRLGKPSFSIEVPRDILAISGNLLWGDLTGDRRSWRRRVEELVAQHEEPTGRGREPYIFQMGPPVRSRESQSRSSVALFFVEALGAELQEKDSGLTDDAAGLRALFEYVVPTIRLTDYDRPAGSWAELAVSDLTGEDYHFELIAPPAAGLEEVRLLTPAGWKTAGDPEARRGISKQELLAQIQLYATRSRRGWTLRYVYPEREFHGGLPATISWRTQSIPLPAGLGSEHLGKRLTQRSHVASIMPIPSFSQAITQNAGFGEERRFRLYEIRKSSERKALHVEPVLDPDINRDLPLLAQALQKFQPLLIPYGLAEKTTKDLTRIFEEWLATGRIAPLQQMVAELSQQVSGLGSFSIHTGYSRLLFLARDLQALYDPTQAGLEGGVVEERRIESFEPGTVLFSEGGRQQAVAGKKATLGPFTVWTTAVPLGHERILVWRGERESPVNPDAGVRPAFYMEPMGFDENDRLETAQFLEGEQLRLAVDVGVWILLDKDLRLVEIGHLPEERRPAGSSRDPIEQRLALQPAYMRLHGDAFWDYSGPQRPAPAQGYKLHVTAAPAEIGQVLDAALPFLREQKIPHKVMRAEEFLGPPSPDLPAEQRDKLITVYLPLPVGEYEARMAHDRGDARRHLLSEEAIRYQAELALSLDGRLAEARLPGRPPHIATDRPLPQGRSGRVFWRYGGRPNWIIFGPVSRDSSTVELYEDPRDYAHALPPWETEETDPFLAALHQLGRSRAPAAGLEEAGARFIVDTVVVAGVLEVAALGARMRAAGLKQVQFAAVATEAELKAALAGLEDPVAREILAARTFTYEAGLEGSHAFALTMARELVPDPQQVITGLSRATLAWFQEVADRLGVLELYQIFRTRVEELLKAA